MQDTIRGILHERNSAMPVIAVTNPAFLRRRDEALRVLLVDSRNAPTVLARIIDIFSAEPGLPRPPVIAIVNPQDLSWALQCGADDVLTVPFSEPDLDLRWLLVEEMARLRAANTHLRHLAYHDHLTSLPNRRYLEAWFERHRRAPHLTTRPFGLHILDLDGFKHINDRFGHKTGDALLRLVGTRLQNTMRRGDIVARLGGDELAIIQLGATSREDLRACASRIVTGLDLPFHVAPRHIRISASVGSALYPTDSTNLATLLHTADIAMYAAKQNGSSRRLRITSTDLLFSPVFDLTDASLTGGHLQPKPQQPNNTIGNIATLLRESARFSIPDTNPFLLSADFSLTAICAEQDGDAILHLVGETGLGGRHCEMIVHADNTPLTEDIISCLWNLKNTGLSIGLHCKATPRHWPDITTLPISRLHIGSAILAIPGGPERDSILRQLTQAYAFPIVAHDVRTIRDIHDMRRFGIRAMSGPFLSPPTTSARLKSLSRTMPPGRKTPP